MVDSKLLKSITTKQEAERILEEINIVKRSLYEEGEGALESVLKNKIRARTAELIRDTFSKGGINRESVLNEITESVEKLPFIRLILAFEPSEGAVERFYTKISEFAAGHVLLDLVYEPQIIGGAVIIYQGEYRDFSFKKLFENQFEKSREKFLGMIKKH